MSGARRTRRRGLRSRLALAIAAVGLLALLTNAALLSVFLNSYLIDRQGTLLARQTTAIGSCCSGGRSGVLLLAPRSLPRAMTDLLAGTPDRRALVLGPSGNLLYASPMPQSMQTELLARLRADLRRAPSGGAAGWHQVGNELISDIRIDMGPAIARRHGGLLLADPVDAVGAQWRRVIALVVLAGGVSLALAVVAGLAAAQVLSRALRAVTAVAHSVAAGNYGERVMPDGPAETAELAEAFNTMIGEVLHRRQVERDLVANVSHELAGPLGLIQGYAEGLADGIIAGEPQRGEALRTIRDETGRLRRLTGDLLDLALLETGQAAVVIEPLPVAELLGGLQQRFAPAAEQAGIRLQLEVAADLPPLETDGLRLEGVLVNLMQNALRYTPAGGVVTLRAWADAGAIVLAVADTGRGIPAEDLPRIWERFYRAERGRDRGRSGAGLGLGLAIGRSTIELLGGSIDVESALLRGTTFSIRLPA